MMHGAFQGADNADIRSTGNAPLRYLAPPNLAETAFQSTALKNEAM
jgi:hypothetical protein